MKNSVTHIAVSIALVLALVVGVVVENHHHDADGSMCLCMHACYHDGHDKHHHDCGCSGDSHSHDEDNDCALHIDNARLDRQESAAHMSAVISILTSDGISIPAPDVSTICAVCFAPCRLSPGRHTSPRAMRGPPATV